MLIFSQLGDPLHVNGPQRHLLGQVRHLVLQDDGRPGLGVDPRRVGFHCRVDILFAQVASTDAEGEEDASGDQGDQDEAREDDGEADVVAGGGSGAHVGRDGGRGGER